MKLHSLEIPENTAETAIWLDRQLVGASLGELVSELVAARSEAAPPATDFDAWLGADRGAVLASGLSELPGDKIGRLLAQPEMLPAMQELVLLEGGAYWQRLSGENSELAGPLARGRDSLERTWAAAHPKSEAKANVAASERAVASGARGGAWLRQSAMASLATAAVLLLAFFVFERERAPVAPSPGGLASGWGWNEAGALPEGTPPADYLNRLADGAQAWFKKRPENSTDVCRRILELRQGCSRLLLADHKPLSNRDREWLIERCYRWAAKFDAQASAIEHGEDPLKVRGETDEAVRTLIDTLKARAKQIATG